MTGTGMRVTELQGEVLRMIRDRDVRLSQLSEPGRQAVIALGMKEAPLVDVDGDYLYLTPLGRSVISGS